MIICLRSPRNEKPCLEPAQATACKDQCFLLSRLIPLVSDGRTGAIPGLGVLLIFQELLFRYNWALAFSKEKQDNKKHSLSLLEDILI